MDMPPALLELLRQPSPCFLATLMSDGSPQMTQTWVDTDGRNVLINTVDGHQKVANVRRDPRVALNVANPEDPSEYVEVRGRVVEHHRATAPRTTSRPSRSATSAVPTRGSAAATRPGCWSRSSPSGSPRPAADRPARVAAVPSPDDMLGAVAVSIARTHRPVPRRVAGAGGRLGDRSARPERGAPVVARRARGAAEHAVGDRRRGRPRRRLGAALGGGLHRRAVQRARRQRCARSSTSSGTPACRWDPT